jgi:hypothetical protein
MAANVAKALSGTLQIMSESLRRAGEVAMEPLEREAKEKQQKEKNLQLAEKKRQDDELITIRKDKESKDAMAAKIAKDSAGAAGKAGRSGTLLGVLGQGAGGDVKSGMKTLLGE